MVDKLPGDLGTINRGCVCHCTAVIIARSDDAEMTFWIMQDNLIYSGWIREPTPCFIVSVSDMGGVAYVITPDLVGFISISGGNEWFTLVSVPPAALR